MQVVDAEDLKVDGARRLGRVMATVAAAVAVAGTVVVVGLRGRGRQGEHREE